ncbi:MAG: hypothetical protein Unbinned2301contig1004_3 [Prokaryotic dsDNA virus sp.]|nr:MAG: hypothetical protein Unbinned2301contig1004_3 [Prokaryotic dsDNA virus sp.]|tara:strand:+ start:15257 stop:15454 length:198 start_codon:yes stop_codon:yes gene_type:complete
MTDAERLDWLEMNTTLHFAVEMLYVVDGYEASLTSNGNPLFTARGDTYRQAVYALKREIAEQVAA